MNRHGIAALALALALLASGCAAPDGWAKSGSGAARSRCQSQPGRSESYGTDQSLVFMLCVESP